MPCKGSHAVIKLSKDVISRLMQDSLCLYCHRKGQSCILLWSRICPSVCYLHCSNTDDAIWQGKPGIWSGGEPVLLLQKINWVQLELKVPELAESVELLKAQGRQRRCGGRSSPLNLQPSGSELCFCVQLHHCSEPLLLKLPCDSSESLPVMMISRSYLIVVHNFSRKFLLLLL